jgi:bifunctional DNA-binding transcriptional regulator/antitoxin component of YhaV-PrlF toxin-antitoxin module
MPNDMATYELSISLDGTLVLPLGLLAEAGLDPGTTVVAMSPSDGRLILRRLDDVADDLINGIRPI